MPAVLTVPARLLGAAVAAALVLAGLALGTVPVASAAESDPMVGAPAVGECYDLTLDEAYAPSTTDTPMSCKRRHTVRVIAVGQVPDGISYDDDRALGKAAKRICTRSWRRYYDWNRPRSQLTLLQGVWLQPTKDQLIAGARWLSCGIALVAGDALVPLPKGGPARASRNPVDSIRRCATGKLDITVCSKKHAWRATHAFAVKAPGGDKARYAKLQKAAQKTCGRRSATPRFVWSSGHLRGTTYAVICYSKTRK